MYGKMQVSGLTEIIPFICISAVWGQPPASWFFYIPRSLFTVGKTRKLDERHCSPLWALSGLRDSHLEAGNPRRLSHPCLLIRGQILHFTLGWTSPVALVVKEPPASARDVRDMSSIPGSG